MSEDMCVMPESYQSTAVTSEAKGSQKASWISFRGQDFDSMGCVQSRLNSYANSAVSQRSSGLAKGIRGESQLVATCDGSRSVDIS